MKKLELKAKTKLAFDIDDQFNFEKTFYSPSAFESRLELYKKEQSVYYLTMNIDQMKLGLKYYVYNGQLCAEIYYEKRLSKSAL